MKPWELICPVCTIERRSSYIGQKWQLRCLGVVDVALLREERRKFHYNSAQPFYIFQQPRCHSLAVHKSRGRFSLSSVLPTLLFIYFLVCIVIYFSNMAEKRAWVKSVILDTLEYAARQHKGSSALPLPIQNAAAEKCFWPLVMYCRQSDFWVARCSFL